VAAGRLLVDSLDFPSPVTGQASTVVLNDHTVIDKTPAGKIVRIALALQDDDNTANRTTTDFALHAGWLRDRKLCPKPLLADRPQVGRHVREQE
jgi:hypothetical protein